MNEPLRKLTFSAPFLFAALVLAVGPSARAQTEVYSNVVGYQRLDVPSDGFALVSSPFEAGTNGSVQQVIGPQLTGGLDLASSDTLLFWNEQTSRFIQLYLHSGADLWVDTSVTPNIVATNEVLNGAGFWMQNIQGSNQTVVVVGDIVSDDSITNTVSPGLQLLSYPYSTDIALNSSGLTNGLPGDFAGSDHVIVWDSGAQEYKQMYLFSSPTSPGTPYHRKWIDTSVTPNVVATNVIQTGDGFWYRRQDTAGNFDWVETRPYVLP